MTQQQGSNVKIIYDTETTFKTTPVVAHAEYLTYVSESIRLNRNLISSRSIRTSRSPQEPVRGNMEISGDITFELSPQHGKMLKQVFGSYTATTGQAEQWYTHTYKIGALPVGMVIEKQFADLATPKYFRYNGCRVNSFRVAVRSEGMIEATVSIMGARETIASGSFDAVATDRGHDPFDAFEATISEGGTVLGTVTELEFTLENNLDGGNYVIDGTGERRSLPAGTARISGTLRALFEDTVLYERAINNIETSLTLALSKGSGTGTATNEKLTFYIDELKFRPQAPIVTGPVGVLVELPFEGYYGDDADETAARAVLLSSVVAYY